jgi:ribosome biogenesis GTPase
MVAQPLPRSAHVLDDPPVANAQQLVLCFSLADPPVEAVQLTRFLVSAEAAGLPFRLVFNKADLGGPARRAEVAHQLAGTAVTLKTKKA